MTLIYIKYRMINYKVIFH